jgi:hypothetical protein
MSLHAAIVAIKMCVYVCMCVLCVLCVDGVASKGYTYGPCSIILDVLFAKSLSSGFVSEHLWMLGWDVGASVG